jgi:histidinol dehydrogenase
MKFYDNPPRINWFKLAERPYIKTEKLEKKVKKILNRVKIEGEDAVHEFNRSEKSYQNRISEYLEIS